MSNDKRAWLPPPWELIDKAIKLTSPSRSQYLEIRRGVVDWYTSILGRKATLQISAIPGDDMNFVDYQLTPDQISDARLWLAEPATDIDEMTNQMIHDGYRISFVYDAKNSCVIVSLIGKSGENPNQGFCLTTRHGTVQQAMELAMFKHIIIFGSGAWGEQGAEAIYG